MPPNADAVPPYPVEPYGEAPAATPYPIGVDTPPYPTTTQGVDTPYPPQPGVPGLWKFNFDTDTYIVSSHWVCCQ